MRYYAVFILIVLTVSACAPARTEISATQPPVTLSSTQDISPTTNICDHLLWPLRDGAIWEYQLSGSDGSLQSLNLSAAIQSGSAHLTLGDASSTLNCLDGSLIGIPPSMLGSGHPSLSGGDALNPRGAFLPSQDVISMNTPWDVEADASGSLLLDSASLPIAGGKLVISSYPLDIEPITTQAGTWSARPVQQTVYYELFVQRADGTQVQVLINAQMQQYFVEGVGIVRVEYLGGSVSSQSGEFNRNLEGGLALELVSYYLP